MHEAIKSYFKTFVLFMDCNSNSRFTYADCFAQESIQITQYRLGAILKPVVVNQNFCFIMHTSNHSNRYWECNL